MQGRATPKPLRYYQNGEHSPEKKTVRERIAFSFGQGAPVALSWAFNINISFGPVIPKESYACSAPYLSLGAFVTFSSTSTGFVNSTVTSISSPTPYGPLPEGLVEVMLATTGVAVEITRSRFAPSEQPLKVTHVPGSGSLMSVAVAPWLKISRHRHVWFLWHVAALKRTH